MKVSFLLLLISLLFFSCSRYQYGVVNSALPKNEVGVIKFENDTVRIEYSFRGIGLPVKVQIFNKLNEPLTVHWDKSSVILHSRSLSMASNRSVVNATGFSQTFAWQQNSTSTVAEFSGEIVAPDKESFLPPDAFVESSLEIMRSKVSLPPDGKTEVQGDYRFKKTRFDRDTSPVTFRSYLTLSLGSPARQLFSVDNHFWVSEFSETALRAGRNPAYQTRMDIFYNTGHAGLIVGGAVVATAALVGLAVGADYASDSMK